jgi:tetratricopeptide (TPR) repeat protein/transcriptional regulator with XRE-family HTH domain
MEEDEMKQNYRLKHEREQRGWSQAKLAELVGTNPATVGRWERGVSLPYPIYREKLCQIFDKDVQELGLIEADEVEQEPTVVIVPDPQLPSMPTTKPFIFDPAIPMLPLETDALVGRDALLAQLKEQFSTEDAGSFSVLTGLPGVGKTTLTLALAYDHEVQEHFSDGILWAGLGTQPDIEEIQARWAAQLGLSQSEVTGHKSRNDWAKILRTAFGLRHMLLIIDDAWEIDDALAFQVGGPHCIYLFTTRFPQIAIQIAGNRSIVVPELSEENGVELLAHFVPALIQQDRATARRLVKSVGGLPLALALMGRYLRSHSYNAQPRRLYRALQDLNTTEKRMHLSDLYGLSRPYSNYSHSTHFSLQSVIALSDERLDDIGAQRMLRALSVFPPKPNTFSEEAAVAISLQSAETLDTLCDVGLIESNGPERYMVHQTIADYAQAQMEDHKGLSERLIAYMTRYIEIHKNEHQAIELEHANILAALEKASQYGMEREFVQAVTTFAPFLRLRGLYDEARQYLQRAYQITQKIDDHIEEMKILSHLGYLLERLSEYKQAESYLSEGLRLAREHKQPASICLFLAQLGTILDRIGEYARAETYLQEGLVLARQLDQPERICEVLISLAIVATNQSNYTQVEDILSEGLQLAQQLEHKEYMLQILTQRGLVTISREDYALARTYFLEALDLAHQIGNWDSMHQLLVNLGGVAGLMGDYEQAERYLQEGLHHSTSNGNQARRAMLLNNLGSLACLQGHYEQAQAYLQEGLNLSLSIDHQRLIFTILCGQGEVASYLQKYEEAKAAFNEVIESAIAFPEIRANAHYGLAQTLAYQGNIDEAYQQAENSAQLFETLGLPKATAVRNWLTNLSTSHQL